MYDFDKIIHREGTNAYKLDLREKNFGTKDVIPLWVADMDFEAPPMVQKAIQARAAHEVYGYTIRKDTFAQSIVDWVQYKHNWGIEKNWIEYSPGVVPALVMSVLAFSQPGDGIIIQPPIYPPFYSIVSGNERKVVENPLVEMEGKFHINFKQLEELASKPENTMLMFCSPHNPTGRVWSEEELRKVNDICLKNNVLVLSDEIHADLALFGNQHIPFATISDQAAQNCLTFMAPSKTFNIAGFSTSYVVGSNPELMAAYRKKQNTLHLHMGHIFSGVALESAYNHGKEWLKELIAYIEENILFVEQFVNAEIPGVTFFRPEATYLIWMNFKEWGMSQKELKHFMNHEAGVGLNDGLSFGEQGNGFLRMNLASPRSILEKALMKIAQAREQN